MTEKKSFGAALVLWFFLGALGAHRMYIQEKVHYLFWFWLVGWLVVWVDIFLLKSMIEKEHEKAEINRKIKAL